MTDSRESWYRTVFWISAVYDIVLGIVFLFFFRPVFEMLGVEDTLPRQTSFISLIAVFLFVIGIAYVLIAMGDLYGNKDLIAIGFLYKVAYFSVALWYLIDGLYPHIIFFWVFGVADALFAVAMAECWLFLRRTSGVALTG